MPAILRLLDGAGFQLQTIAMSQPSLDDVFLQLTGHRAEEPADEAGDDPVVAEVMS